MSLNNIFYILNGQYLHSDVVVLSDGFKCVAEDSSIECGQDGGQEQGRSPCVTIGKKQMKLEGTRPYKCLTSRSTITCAAEVEPPTLQELEVKNKPR